MRIISQDRTFSLNFDKINIFREGLSLVAMNESMDKKVMLGIYQTEERAAEVFGDIHNAYSPVSLVIDKLTDEQAAAFIGSQYLKSNIIRLPEDRPNACVTTYENTVYYMPEVQEEDRIWQLLKQL